MGHHSKPGWTVSWGLLAFLAGALAGASACAQGTAGKSGSASRQELRSKAANMAAGIQAAETALTPEQLAIAERVYVGRMPCELGQVVQLSADPERPGTFRLQLNKQTYRMTPVESRTGAVRLEDAKAGAVWIQLMNKSMLMNHKIGQRMADECMHATQQAVAEELKLRPAPSLLAPAPAPVAQDPALAKRP